MVFFKKRSMEVSNSANQQVRLMTISDLNACLKEALYTDSVGCSESVLFDISQATYHIPFMNRIMKLAWSCIKSRASKYRRIQKALTLLSYLAINGSENCINDIVTHLDYINGIHRLKFHDNNKEIGVLIKEKAVQLTALVCDIESLMNKRKYAASIRDRFISVGSSSNGRVEIDRLHKPVFVLDNKSSLYHQSSNYQQNQIYLGNNLNKNFINPNNDNNLSNFFKSSLQITSTNKPTQQELYDNIQNNISLYDNSNSKYNLKDNIFDTPSQSLHKVKGRIVDSSSSSSSSSTSSSSSSSSDGRRSNNRKMSRTYSRSLSLRSYSSKSTNKDKYNKKDRRSLSPSSDDSTYTSESDSYNDRNRSPSPKDQYYRYYNTRQYHDHKYDRKYNDYDNDDYHRYRQNSNPFR